MAPLNPISTAESFAKLLLPIAPKLYELQAKWTHQNSQELGICQSNKFSHIGKILFSVEIYAADGVNPQRYPELSRSERKNYLPYKVKNVSHSQTTFSMTPTCASLCHTEGCPWLANIHDFIVIIRDQKSAVPLKVQTWPLLVKIHTEKHHGY